MSSYGLLHVMMNPRPENEPEFNAWYDTEHVPERLAVPGFLNARRWIAQKAPAKYLAVYDLESPDVLETAEYRAVSGVNNSPWTRRVLAGLETSVRTVYEQIWPGAAAARPDAGALLTVAIDMDPEHEDELNCWYHEEHLDRLLKAPGFLQARRFRAVDGGPKYLAVYDLESPRAVEPSPRLQAADTEWTRRMRQLYRRVLRGTYLPYVPDKTG